jgi:hypothetical protein
LLLQSLSKALLSNRPYVTFLVMDTNVGPKRNKRMGAPHEQNYEALEDPNVAAKAGWEEHDEEYWSYKTIKQYVKLYHISKLWPRNLYQVITKSFTSKP